MNSFHFSVMVISLLTMGIVTLKIHAGGQSVSQNWAFSTLIVALVVVSTVSIVVQINGKKKGEVSIAPDASQDDALAAAKALDKVAGAIEGKSIKREIYVPGRLVNIVAK